MKKLILISLLALSGNAFAKENLIYCPEKVVCSIAGDINSCRLIGGTIKEIKRIAEGGKIEKGIYFFSHANGYYQQPNPSVYSNESCSYELALSSKFKKIIVIGLQGSHDLPRLYEARLNENNRWNIVGYIASCQSTNPLDCPFVQL